MRLYGATHDRQAHARAAELAARMQALQRCEQFVGVAQVEADAAALDVEGVLPIRA
jgi:hypothetical protein